MEEKKTEAFNTRIVPSLRERMNRIHKRHLTTDALVASMLITAFCDTVERREKVAAPYTMLDADEVANASAAELLQLVAETQAHYGHHPPNAGSSSPGAAKQSA